MEVAHPIVPEKILVVGGSGAIGQAIVRSLSSPSTLLGIHYCHNRKGARDLGIQLSRQGFPHRLLKSTLKDQDECQKLVDSFFGKTPGYFGLVLAGGLIVSADWRQIKTEIWNDAFFQHCIVPYFLATRVIDLMEKYRKGKIVFLSSISPKYGGSDSSLHYATAKAALETTMHGLQRRVAGHGITINGIRAGFIDTPLQRKLRSGEEISNRISKILLKRGGSPEEIAGGVAYFMSSLADYTVGQILTIAGGD